jgi:hypothetical protein
VSANVRTHTRRNPDGSSTTVHQHSRKTRGGRGRRRRKGLLQSRRAARNLRRAFRALRRKKKRTALVYGGLAAGEMAGVMAIRGVALTLTTVGLVALGVAYAASKATGDK